MLQSIVIPDDNALNETTRDAVNSMICPKQSGTSLSNGKRVLQQCDNCPKYNVPQYESSCTTIAPKIKFHLNVIFSTCFIHGLLGEGRLIYDICENKK